MQMKCEYITSRRIANKYIIQDCKFMNDWCKYGDMPCSVKMEYFFLNEESSCSFVEFGCYWFDPHQEHCILSLSMPSWPLLNADPTQETFSYEWNIIRFDVTIFDENIPTTDHVSRFLYNK